MGKPGRGFGGYESVIPGARKFGQITLSQAQINSLFTTAVTFLTSDAQHANMIDEMWLVRSAGTAYAGGTGNLLIRLNAVTWIQIAPASLLGAAGPRYAAALYPNFSSADITSLLNTSWDVKLQTADPTPATGTGTLTLKYSYRSIFVGRR